MGQIQSLDWISATTLDQYIKFKSIALQGQESNLRGSDSESELDISNHPGMCYKHSMLGVFCQAVSMSSHSVTVGADNFTLGNFVF